MARPNLYMSGARQSGCGQLSYADTINSASNIEFPGISQYSEYASEFVRYFAVESNVWRRDEWAYSPLFICGAFPERRRQ
jgi:hypothetical protein